MSDILHRIRDGKPCVPKNVVLVWSVKRSKELSLLTTVDMESICPFFSEKLNLEIQTYVTQELESPLVGFLNFLSFFFFMFSFCSSLVHTLNTLVA